MVTVLPHVQAFREEMAALPREELIQRIREFDVELYKGINRIDWVFKNRMKHLDVDREELTNEELALLLDPPFKENPILTQKDISLEKQHYLHVAADPVLWAKQYLKSQLRVYQILMLRDPSNRKVLRWGRRLGKALDVVTPIPTPNGWTTMGELREGDQVFDENGKPCTVTFATEYQYGRQCYEVVFSDGSTIIADADHQWSVYDKHSRKALTRNDRKQIDRGFKTLTTEEMLETLYHNGEVNYSIPLTAPVEYEEKKYVIDPWLFGFWLGDESSDTGVLTVEPEDQDFITQKVQDSGRSAWASNFKYDVNQLVIEDLHHDLGAVGVRKEHNRRNLVTKFIPCEYLEGSVEQRDELLKGLMDSGGTVAVNGNCEFSVCNERLAEDVYELIQSLGYRATWKEGPAKLNGRVIGQRYRINWTPWRPVFSLPRKLARQKLSDEPSNRQRWRYIVDIRPVETRPVKCISVDSPNSLYLAGKNFIPTHNTYSLATLLLHYSYTTNNGRCLVMAPMKSHVSLIYDEIWNLIKKGGALVGNAVVRSVKHPQHEFVFSNGSTIRLFTTGVKSGSRSDVARGQEAHVIVLDEMDYMGVDDLDALYAMLQKTDANQPDKIMIGASTPTGRRERFWEWNMGITPDGKSMPEETRFKAFYFPSYCSPHWNKTQEDEFRALYNEMAYRHEIEADWGEDVEGVYPRRFVDAAFIEPSWNYVPRRMSQMSHYLMGVDWDKHTAGPNIVVLEVCPPQGGDPRFAGRLKLAHREEIPRHEYVLTEAVQRVIDLNAAFQPEWIYVDRGFGDCVAPDTWITTRDGGKPIIDIEVGDEVLASDGQFHEVLGKVVRDDPKHTYRVKVAKNLPVEVSDTHPFYAWTKSGEMGWKNVTELQVGDLIAVQKPANTEFVGSKRFYKVRDDGSVLSYSNLGKMADAGFGHRSAHEVRTLLAQQGLMDWDAPWEMSVGCDNKINRGTRKTVGMAREGSSQTPSVTLDVLAYTPADCFDDASVWARNANGHEHKVNRFYDVFSESFLTFAGWFLSEGSVYQHSVEVSQSIESDEHVKEIVSCMRNVFGIEPQVCEQEDDRQPHYKRKGRFIVNSKPIAKFVAHLLGRGSKNKKIPAFMMRYPHMLGPLVRAALRGDGSLSSKDGRTYEIELTSRVAIDQLRLILLSQSILPSIYKVDKGNHSPAWKLLVAGDQEYTQRFSDFLGIELKNPNRVNRSCTIFYEDKIFVPIRKIEYLGKTSGLVDIEVEGAKSFVGNGVLLHNTQVELLKKYGTQHTETMLHKRVKGVQFGEMIEVNDPFTRQPVKKDIKPFMVDNLRGLLEREQIVFPSSDEELYMQLISYVVARVTPLGRPVYEASGSQQDHAHDALILACLAFTQNYGDLFNLNIVRRGMSVSSEPFTNLFSLSRSSDEREKEVDIIEKTWGDVSSAPVQRKRRNISGSSRKGSRKVKRKMF